MGDEKMNRINISINIININIKSFYYIPQIIILMVFILAISSLLTVLERKGLASFQRRIGPSYHGWFGLLQIVADGIKLVFKDSSLLGFFRSSITSSSNAFTTMILPPLWSFVWSYLVFAIWWSDYSLSINIPFIFLAFFVIQGISHIGIVICGLFTQSRWTVLGSLRSLILYIVYDLVLLVSWFILLPHNKIGCNFYESSNFGTINSFIDSQPIWNLFLYPWLVLLFLIAILVESGRIPSDLTEAESELVSLLLLGGGSILSLFLKSSFVFLLFIAIRATLPRLRYTDLLIFSWSYAIPFQVLSLSLLLLF